MTLLELQRDFRHHIVDGTDAITERIPDHARRGLRVYRHAYHATLVDCLRDTYEKTVAWLGDEAFEAAADDYVHAYPPTGWTLAGYGWRFPDALTLRYPDDPEIGELAWLDLSLRKAFSAAALPAIDHAMLADVDWETAKIRFAPHVAARATRTNVVAIWNALAAEEMPPACKADLSGGLLVWREDLSPKFRTAQAVETAALTAMLAGKSFAETCASLAETHDLAANDMGAMLSGWLRDGLIVAIA